MKTRDKTVLKGLSFCGFGLGANTSAVDVLDGKIVRTRPLHYNTVYSDEEINPWTIEKNGKKFGPGEKTLIPPFSVAYKQRYYSNNRVPYPLKRVDWDPDGDRNPQTRGESKYERISWDEATDIIAKEIVRIHEEYGPTAILAQADGHGETKVIHASHGCQSRMLNLIGGYTLQARQPDSWEGWYWGAKHIWGMDPVGKQTRQTNMYKDIVENGDAVILVGADPETTPWGWGGMQPSRMCAFLREVGVKLICISPDLNYTNAVHADIWIPVYPNTDAALWLGVAHTWFEEESFDREYIDTHSVGFDWFERYVTGGEDNIPKDAAWASKICGVPEYKIKALARYWATHAVATAHCNGGSYIRSCFAEEPARLEVALLAMQGLGKPGTGQMSFIEFGIFGYPEYNPLPRSTVIPELATCYQGYVLASTGYGSFIPKTMIHKAILEPPITWYGHTVAGLPREDQFDKYQFPREGEPDLHMIWSDTPCWQVCWNGGNEYIRALRDEKIEFILVQHPWMENDTTYADIILPVSTKFEQKDIAVDNYSGQYNLLLIEDQAVEVRGEAKSDYETVIEIAKKLEKYGGKYENLVERYTQGNDIDDWIKNGYEHSGVKDLISWEDFKKNEFYVVPTAEGWEDDTVAMREWYDDAESAPLSTPSGKIEFYSLGLAEYFPDDEERPIYPKWVHESEEHKERLDSDRAKDYPYLIVSNHPRWRVHANMDDVTWFREIETCKVEGPDGYYYEPVWINPVDAKELNVKDGDVVSIFNERGRVLGGVYVTERIMPGVVYQDHGARVDPIVHGEFDRAGSNNLICPSATTSKNAAGEVTSGFLVGVEKVDVFELAKQYPDAFNNRDYRPEDGMQVTNYLVDEEA